MATTMIDLPVKSRTETSEEAQFAVLREAFQEGWDDIEAGRYVYYRARQNRGICKSGGAPRHRAGELTRNRLFFLFVTFIDIHFTF